MSSSLSLGSYMFTCIVLRKIFFCCLRKLVSTNSVLLVVEVLVLPLLTSDFTFRQYKLIYCYKRLFNTLPAFFFFFLNFLYITYRISCLTLFFFPWWWERLKAGGEGDDRGWDSWKASLTQWLSLSRLRGVGDGQGSPACCSPWGCKESDTTERQLKQWQLLKDCCLTISDCNIGYSERHSNFKSVKM